MSVFEPGIPVEHAAYGRGTVITADGPVVIVRYEHGIEASPTSDLEALASLAGAIASSEVHSALEVVARALSLSIQSVNDGWGVFSRSRITLLPHQLWVCKRVLEKWPTRWLVADDVGLGKTIEAGLILTPLIARRKVQRLLILTPASLVEQWQERLREMFDIRVTTYTPELDTPRSDYWGTHPMVAASAHTLRLDSRGRWERLLDSSPWDLVMVDEAHHLNDDEQGGATLSYKLVEAMQERGLINSLLFFTGTPHRGKDYNFLSLLSLLRPDLFNPKEPMTTQVSQLRDVMIRNNKARVTDMDGEPVFTPVKTSIETYEYSPEETEFYSKLTGFILGGKAYANTLTSSDQRTAILVLITMQKLASSSVAAVRKAIRGRMARLADAETNLYQANSELLELQELSRRGDVFDGDRMSRLEGRVVEATALLVNQDEIPALRELLSFADEVESETKIERILAITEERFSERSVLFFTEYKATQALLISALHRRYGQGCATFINGDGALDDVWISEGKQQRMTTSRQAASDAFNRGSVRFLVSTEAAGEGVDLQESCSALIHVDLPWNPMRLHQRVGRLSRYGQTLPVDVVSVRNPDTVEAQIWAHLEAKLERITTAFVGAMDDPEDMKQQVLGMASPGFFEQILASARSAPAGGLDKWFDAKTATFGGDNAVQTVRDLFGHVAQFDFGTSSKDLPRVDLPHLIPFMKSALTLHHRRYQDSEDGFSFKTPKAWQARDFAIIERYDLRFAREAVSRDEALRIAGVGHRVVDAALADAEALKAAISPVQGLRDPILLFAVRDRVTGRDVVIRRLIYGVQRAATGLKLLRDWEVILELQDVASMPSRLLSPDERVQLDDSAAALLAEASAWIESVVPQEELLFQYPKFEALLMLMGTPAAHIT